MEFMLAQLTSWVVNTGFRSTKEPSKPRDFMPPMFARAEQPQKVNLKRRRRKTIAFELRTNIGHFLRNSK